jgi:hypothetical protein
MPEHRFPPEGRWAYSVKRAIKSLPEEGSYVLAVVERNKGGRLLLSQDQFDFMPQKSPLLVVSGLDDPKVNAIMSRLRTIISAEVPSRSAK